MRHNERRRNPDRSWSAGLACLSGLEHSPSRAAVRSHCCAPGRPAAAGKLDADLHEERCRLCRTVFPDLSPRCAVRQADGSQRFGRGHRQISDRAPRHEASHARHRADGSFRHLWRRQPVRCILRVGAHGPRLVQGCQYTTSPDARGHRTWHVDFYNVGDARHARDPERDTDAVFRHQSIRRSRPRLDCVCDHARISACGGWRARRPGHGGPERPMPTAIRPIRRSPQPTGSSASAPPPRANSIPRRLPGAVAPPRSRRSFWPRFRSLRSYR